MGSKYEERLERIRTAVALEKPDRIPYIGAGTGYSVKLMGASMHDYFDDSRVDYNCTVNLEAAKKLQVDAVQATLFSAKSLSIVWYSEVEVPGYDIPDDSMWQVEEKELIHEEDYDRILEVGFPQWNDEFFKAHFGDIGEMMGPIGAYTPTALKRFKDADIVPLSSASLAAPFEMFCGGRTMLGMLTEDLYDYPEKLEEVFKQVHEVNMANGEAQFSVAPEDRPIGAGIGGWRGTPMVLSPDDFEHWSWKYMMDYYHLCLDYGVIPIFHMDSVWDKGLHYFNELEKGTCIMGLDGQTNIKLAHEICGENCCIMGDVPASKLAFNTPDDVYDYAMDLCKTFDGRGYLMSSGCDVPYNAKLENVNMMLKAVEDFEKMQ